MRRDRHKFYLEAFSLMAPIAWQGSTPASNSCPQLLLPVGAGGERLLCPRRGRPARGRRGVCLRFKWDGDARRQTLCFPLSPMCTGFPPHPGSAAPLLGTSSHLHGTAHPSSSGEDATEPHIRTGHRPPRASSKGGQEAPKPCRPHRYLWLHGPGSDPQKPQELCRELERDQRFPCERGQRQEEGSGGPN